MGYGSHQSRRIYVYLVNAPNATTFSFLHLLHKSSFGRQISLLDRSPKNIFFLLKLATNVLKKTPHTEHRAWEMIFR